MSVRRAAHRVVERAVDDPSEAVRTTQLIEYEHQPHAFRGEGLVGFGARTLQRSLRQAELQPASLVLRALRTKLAERYLPLAHRRLRLRLARGNVGAQRGVVDVGGNLGEARGLAHLIQQLRLHRCLGQQRRVGAVQAAVLMRELCEL